MEDVSAELTRIVGLTALLVQADGQDLGTGTCSAFYFALILLVSLHQQRSEPHES